MDYTVQTNRQVTHDKKTNKKQQQQQQMGHTGHKQQIGYTRQTKTKTATGNDHKCQGRQDDLKAYR